ncbi:hypothetical protein [Intestinibacter sp.]|uniref:hypothetical protein n=1 Tax=Intestinibacter sp. TaxID=1965304 RepID=UPI002A759F82|nr:hypothetical protein [Intestinibacter sp.]MDY2737094.1 hypothetical protein [Intestinibacter sp.]
MEIKDSFEENKKELSWVVGEAIHFAYEVGYLDCELKRGYSKFDKIVEEVLGYLDNDSERNTLKKILNMEV